MANLAVVPGYQPTVADQALERKLHLAQAAILYETDELKRAEMQRKFSQLHATRSPEYVAWMERKKGLRSG